MHKTVCLINLGSKINRLFDIVNIKRINYAIFDQALISGSNFCISLILARVMSTEEFGSYVFSFTLLVFAVGLLNSIAFSPLNVLGASAVKKDQYIYNLFYIFFAASVTISCLFFIVGIILSKNGCLNNGSVFSSLSYILIVYLGQEFVRNALLVGLKTVQVLFVDFISYSIRLLTVGGTLFFDYQLTCIDVIRVYGLSSLVAVICGLTIIQAKKIWKGNTIDKRIMIETWEYAKWTFADWVPFVLSAQLYVYIVTFVLGNSATGIIGAVRNLLAPLSIVLIGFMNFMLPYYSKYFTQQGEKKVIKSLAIVFGILISGVSIYLGFVNYYSTELLQLLFGKYGQYSNLVAILSCGIFINYLFKPADIYLKVSRNPQYIFFARFGAGLATLIICYPLIKLYGIKGAAWSVAASQAVMCIGVYSFMICIKLNVLGSSNVTKQVN